MSSADETGPSPFERGAYKLWSKEHVRFSDTDINGHVNHAVFVTYFESGRVQITRDPQFDLIEDGCNFNVVRIELDYKAELRFPGNIDIGLRGIKYGRTSFRIGHGIFQGDKCLCTEEAVLVYMDRATRKPRPLSEKLIAWLKDNGATAN